MKTRAEIDSMPDSAKADLIENLQQILCETETRLTQQQQLLNIYKLWFKNREKLYPDNCRGINIRGIDLDDLRQTIAGCVTAFLTRDQLSAEQREYLYASQDDLEWVTRELQGYEGFYFRQLKVLVTAIIGYESRASEVFGESDAV